MQVIERIGELRAHARRLRGGHAATQLEFVAHRLARHELEHERRWLVDDVDDAHDRRVVDAAQQQSLAQDPVARAEPLAVVLDVLTHALGDHLEAVPSPTHRVRVPTAVQQHARLEPGNGLSEGMRDGINRRDRVHARVVPTRNRVHA